MVVEEKRGKFVGIIVACPNCGKERWRVKSHIDVNNPPLCLTCSAKSKNHPVKIDWGDLYHLYIKDELSCAQIAEIKGCCKSAVRATLKRNQIQVRPSGLAQHLLFQKMYKSHHGNKSPHWKGGRITVNSNGRFYIQIKLFQDDLFYCMASKRGYVMEHRLIMARQLNRPLLANEYVHHINGDTLDNRTENLKLVSISDHNIYTELCKQCPIRKDVRLLKWQIKQLQESLNLIKEGT